MAKIPSFEEYKERILKEDFYNPFDQEDDKKKEPIQVKDFGGFFKLKKESFNLGRVEYMKRPGGDYTIIGKTQFAKGEVIEICPVVLVGEICKTLDKVKDLIFELDKKRGMWGLVLGYGSLYRHSDKPNVDYAYNPKNRQMYFITNRPIKSHEELTINYGTEYWQERTNFHTVAEIPSVNIGLDASTLKPENESQVQSNAADQNANASKMMFGQPNSNANPAVSGVPIQGIGQQ